MEGFRHLRVWHESHRLALDIYRLAATFPDFEKFSLAAQIRDAASSIPANIAEGCGRRNSTLGNAELVRFLHMAMGSATELEYRLLLARDLGYVTREVYDVASGKTIAVERMLSRFVIRLRELDRTRRRRAPVTAVRGHAQPLTSPQAHKPTSPQAPTPQPPPSPVAPPPGVRQP